MLRSPTAVELKKMHLVLLILEYFLKQIQHGVLNFFSLKVSLGIRLQLMVLPSVCNCNHGDGVFDVAFRSLSYLKVSWDFLLSATHKNNQFHCIVFPNDSTDGESFTKCDHR